MKRILFIEGDFDCRQDVTGTLIKKDFIVDSVDSPITGLEHLATNDYSLVITDLDLPIINGIQFCESAKIIRPKTPIIILSDDESCEMEISAIENNVDLYLDKDKPVNVLMNYVNRYTSDYKINKQKDVVLTSANNHLVVNISNHTVYCGEEPVDLTPIEFTILKQFLENKNKVLSREDIIDYAWKNYPDDIDVRVVDTHIKRLREKISTFSITTIRGFGYRWNESE